MNVTDEIAMLDRWYLLDSGEPIDLPASVVPITTADLEAIECEYAHDHAQMLTIAAWFAMVVAIGIVALL